jgi:hypothetical protein
MVLLSWEGCVIIYKFPFVGHYPRGTRNACNG